MAGIFVANLDRSSDRTALERSVAAPVDRQLIIQNFSDATYPELIEIERRGHGFYAWGLGDEAGEVECWFRMQVGDWVLVGCDDHWRYCARVLGRYENLRAARSVWGDDGRAHLFFLSEPVKLKLACGAVADYLARPAQRFAAVDSGTRARIVADFGTTDRFVRRRLLNTGAGGPIVDMSGLIRLSEKQLQKLRAEEEEDSQQSRQAIINSIIRRRGHPALRETLLKAYEARCAVTNFCAPDTLEVARILPWREGKTHHPSNALLLRTDIHTLFDLGKLAIDTRSMTVVLAEELMNSSYRLVAGRPLRYPEDETMRPDPEALDMHRRLAGL